MRAVNPRRPTICCNCDDSLACWGNVDRGRTHLGRGDPQKAICEAFCLLDADHHPVAVDVGRSQVERFRDPQTGGLIGRQDLFKLVQANRG